jgi:hypothetical protein
MYPLTDKQIDFILDDIRRRGVEMEDLQYNLLDHICCIIEQNLESDGNFEDFYNKTVPKFFKHELWEIEEEAILLLTYKNYYTMKKAMILGGNISLGLIALGTVLKIFHWPGAAISLLLGFIILCFVFFPSALYLNYNSAKKGLGINLTAFLGGTILMIGVLFKVMHWPGTPLLLILGFGILLGIFIPLLLISKLREGIPSKQKAIYTLGALGLIPFGAATLFKIMHWPGTAPLLIIGSFLLICIFIPLYTNMQIKANKMSPGQFIFVITLSMYAVVLTFLLAMNVSKHVLESFLRDETDNALIVNYFEKKKARLEGEMQTDSVLSLNESKKLLNESAAKTKALIRNIRLELVSAVEGVDETTARHLLLHPNQMIKIDNYDIPTALLFNGEPEPSRISDGNTKASELKASIEIYKSQALRAAGNNEQLANKIKALLNTGDNITNEIKMSWEQCNFYHSPLISTLVRLSNLEKNICLVETEVLTLKN